MVENYVGPDKSDQESYSRWIIHYNNSHLVLWEVLQITKVNLLRESRDHAWKGGGYTTKVDEAKYTHAKCLQTGSKKSFQGGM